MCVRGIMNPTPYSRPYFHFPFPVQRKNSTEKKKKKKKTRMAVQFHFQGRMWVEEDGILE
uniref:Uncharacterized protein n=1 Tax=Strigamia maritima TaxID=126957 RepID=T1IXA8_STRMM